MAAVVTKIDNSDNGHEEKNDEVDDVREETCVCLKKKKRRRNRHKKGIFVHFILLFNVYK